MLLSKSVRMHAFDVAHAPKRSADLAFVRVSRRGKRSGRSPARPPDALAIAR
jgi:hypothetical protein